MLKRPQFPSVKKGLPGSVIFCESPWQESCLLPEEIRAGGGIILSLNQVKLLY